MTELNATPASEKRRLEVSASADDLLVRLLSIPSSSYECVTVNSSWPEKGLIEGDIVLCVRDRSAGEGDIVLIEQNGAERLGVMSTPGYLETPRGNRLLEATENISGVGVALARGLNRET